MGELNKGAQERLNFSNDRLGRIAQEQIGLFAEAAHLNKSASNPDLDGWDFHFSVPRDAPVDGSAFFDADPPLTAMFAQVKGTTGHTRRRAVALSHWLHAATMPMPFFFIVLEFDKPPIPARLFIVHVDGDLIETVAKRLRLEGSKAKAAPPDLRKLTMDLVWNESHQVPCTPEELRAALLQHTGKDMRCYAETKREWWNSAGEDTVSHHLSLRFRGPHSEIDRRLADWALGLTDSLTVDEFRRVEHRWGIPRAFEARTDVTVSFGVPPTLGRTLVRISDPNGVEHAEFEADVFCNVCIVPHLPKETWAIRLRWNFLQIIIRAMSKNVRVQLTIPPNQPPVLLSELATAGRALRLLCNESQMTYSIPGHGAGREYTSTLSQRDLQADGDLDVTKMLEAAEAAWNLSTLFGVPSDFMITPNELEDQAEELVQWRLAQTSDHVTVQINAVGREDLVEGERASFLWFLSLELGKYELVAAAVVEGEVQFIDARARVHARPTYVRRWVVNRAHRVTWVARDFPRLVHELVCEHEKQGKVCLIADQKLGAAVAELRAQQEALATTRDTRMLVPHQDR